MYFAIFVVATGLAVIIFLKKYANLLYYASRFEGPLAYPIIGNALWFLNKSPSDILRTMEKLIQIYGKIFRIWMGPKLIICIGDPKDLEVVLSSQKLIDKSDEYVFMRDWLGQGLLLSSGKKWYSRRKAITPTFHFKILEQFVETFDKQGNILASLLKEHASTQEAFDIFPFITLYALDVICESAMGTSAKAQSNSDSEYVRAVKTITNIIHIRMFDLAMRSDLFYLSPSFRRQKHALKILHDYTDNVIVRRRQELLQKLDQNIEFDENYNLLGVKRKMALLDVLLQTSIDGKPLTNLEIREEVDTFMFEGHDTTTSAISFALYCIAKNQEVQKKAIEEIHRVFGSDINAPANLHDLNELHYLELVIKETLRLYPSVPIMARKVLENFDLNGQIIPAESSIVIGTFFTQRSDLVFDNPLEFIPERFDAVRDPSKTNPFQYIPFSAGPRNCIGQKFAMYEMKSAISKFLRHFEISLPKDSKEPELVAELILRPKDGIFVQIKPRI